MIEAKGVPDDDVFYHDRVTLYRPALDACTTKRLICIVVCREKLALFVLGYPYGMFSEL